MNIEAYTSTKTYRNLPCAHRQWKNEGHCSFVHGYSREFIFHFSCDELDKHGWVVDFGGLKDLNVFLEYWFDHTLLLAEDDPLLEEFRDLESNLNYQKSWMLSGTHYEKTSNAWLSKMDHNREKILTLFKKNSDIKTAKRNFHFWRLFFIACAEIFGYANGSEWCVSHHLFNKSD